MVREEGHVWSAEPTSDQEATASFGGPESVSELVRGTIVGRYTVLSLVGRGGMSEVYAAYDPALDRKVALKVLKRASGLDEHQQSRLHREARAIAQISHPNVIAVHEVGTFGDRVFIAIEFVEGKTLRAWLAERPRSRGEILAAFIEAARGLAAAHAKGLMHRDFKPHNVLVGNDGLVRVTDFGLARWIDEAATEIGDERPSRAFGADLTRTGQLVGTPLYMAPEQFDGGPMDARTDQFSFCVALYEALYGEHPFSAIGYLERSAPVRAREVRPPAARSTVPAWQRRALVRGLTTAPAARWSSMDELVCALTTDPARRRRRSVALATTVVLAIAGTAAAWRASANSETRLCSVRQPGLVGIWGPSGRDEATDARRNAVQAAFLAPTSSFLPRSRHASATSPSSANSGPVTALVRAAPSAPPSSTRGSPDFSRFAWEPAPLTSRDDQRPSSGSGWASSARARRRSTWALASFLSRSPFAATAWLRGPCHWGNG